MKNTMIGLLTIAFILLGREAQSQIMFNPPTHQISGIKELEGYYRVTGVDQLQSTKYFVSGDSVRWVARFINSGTGVFGTMLDDTSTIRFGKILNFQGINHQSHRAQWDDEDTDKFLEVLQSNRFSETVVGHIIVQLPTRELKFDLYDNGRVEIDYRTENFEGYLHIKGRQSILSFIIINKDGDSVEDGHYVFPNPLVSGDITTTGGKKIKITIKKLP